MPLVDKLKGFVNSDKWVYLYLASEIADAVSTYYGIKSGFSEGFREFTTDREYMEVIDEVGPLLGTYLNEAVRSGVFASGILGTHCFSKYSEIGKKYLRGMSLSNLSITPTLTFINLNATASNLVKLLG